MSVVGEPILQSILYDASVFPLYVLYFFKFLLQFNISSIMTTISSMISEIDYFATVQPDPQCDYI